MNESNFEIFRARYFLIGGIFTARYLLIGDEARTNFDDFQHIYVSSFLIAFICWKDHEFACVYDSVTLALNNFYFDRLSKKRKMLIDLRIYSRYSIVQLHE